MLCRAVLCCVLQVPAELLVERVVGRRMDPQTGAGVAQNKRGEGKGVVSACWLCYVKVPLA